MIYDMNHHPNRIVIYDMNPHPNRIVTKDSCVCLSEFALYYYINHIVIC